MPSKEYVDRQNKDVENAVREHNKLTSKSESDLRARSVAEKLVGRKNLYDKLDEDLRSAGQTEYERKIFGK